MQQSLITLLLTGLVTMPVSSSAPPEPILADSQSVDYGTSISPDGKSLYYTHAGEDMSRNTLMVADLDNGRVKDTTALRLDGKIIEGSDVQISPDGNTLVFSSRTAIERKDPGDDSDLFFSIKTEHGWAAPERFPDHVNSERNEYYPRLTNSGNLYFARETQHSLYDIYVSEYQQGQYQRAEKLSGHINTTLLESDAYVSPDEHFMVFVRMLEADGQGVSDLYIAFKEPQGWSVPVNLGSQINFAGVDGSPFVTEDKAWLYFTSNRSAPEPTKFDTHLGIYRLPFKQTYQLHKKHQERKRVYADVTAATPFFQQGPVIFNTSMPDNGSSHFFTDNRGFEWGPTAIYQRDVNEQPSQLAFPETKIPADIHVSPLGTRLYFADYGDNPSRVYVSERVDGIWQAPQLHPWLPPGSGYLTSTNEGVIYFSLEGDIYRANGESVSRLDDTINSEAGEQDPFIAQDGSFLIVVRQDSPSDSNMYLSVPSPGGWSEPVKLPAPFNTDVVDGSPYVTADKRYLFVSSNRDDGVLKTWQVPFYTYLHTKLNRQSRDSEQD